MEPETNRFRLSVMMYGQYLIMGAWVVTLATFLMSPPTKGGLNFSASHTGWIYSSLAIAGIISPFFMGLLADRLFASERLMAFFHLLGSGLLGLAAYWCSEHFTPIDTLYRNLASTEFVEGIPLLEAEQTHHPVLKEAIRLAQERINTHPDMESLIDSTFYPLFGIMMGYSFCFLITLTLSNVLAMRNLRDPQRSFGGVRLYGTIGWISGGILVELGLKAISPAPLYFASGLSLVMGIFCFFLPHTPPSGKGKTLAESFGLPALKLFTDRSFTVLIVCSFGFAITQQFYAIYTNRYLNELGAPLPAAIQTIAQVAEVISMILLPFAVPRLGIKWMIALGMFALFFRNGIFATESLWFVVLAGLPLHGFSYAFFYIVAAIYVDRKSPPHLRASAQGIFTFITLGSGTLIGNWFGSKMVQSRTLGNTVDWMGVWLIPMIMCLVLSSTFAWLFRDDVSPPEPTVSPKEMDSESLTPSSS
jgi:nucleoside transporter